MINATQAHENALRAYEKAAAEMKRMERAYRAAAKANRVTTSTAIQAERALVRRA